MWMNKKFVYQVGNNKKKRLNFYLHVRLVHKLEIVLIDYGIRQSGDVCSYISIYVVILAYCINP